MSREYPKFLFSDPHNTVSKGPFVVHLLYPRKLYKIEWLFVHGDFDLKEIKDWGDECSEEESGKILRQLIKWLNQQLSSREIVYPLTLEERQQLLKNSLPEEAQKNLTFFKTNKF